MSKFKLSEKVKSDIVSIWKFTEENWPTNQADKYYNLILDEIEHLAMHPNTGRRYTILKKDYFGSKVKSHIIFYLKTNDDKIEVVRILHSKMDLAKRLNE